MQRICLTFATHMTLRKPCRICKAAWNLPYGSPSLGQVATSVRPLSSADSGMGNECERETCLELFGYSAGTAPKKSDLKSKYLELAKQMHPDAAGNEVAFQHLQRCYDVLLQDGRQEPEWLRKLREDYATSKDPFP
eukprot:s2353_g8.t1